MRVNCYVETVIWIIFDLGTPIIVLGVFCELLLSFDLIGSFVLVESEFVGLSWFCGEAEREKGESFWGVRLGVVRLSGAL